MPSNLKGPAIFLAQFAGDSAPFNTLDATTERSLEVFAAPAANRARTARVLGLGEARARP